MALHLEACVTPINTNAEVWQEGEGSEGTRPWGGGCGLCRTLWTMRSGQDVTIPGGRAQGRSGCGKGPRDPRAGRGGAPVTGSGGAGCSLRGAACAGDRGPVCALREGQLRGGVSLLLLGEAEVSRGFPTLAGLWHGGIQARGAPAQGQGPVFSPLGTALSSRHLVVKGPWPPCALQTVLGLLFQFLLERTFSEPSLQVRTSLRL